MSLLPPEEFNRLTADKAVEDHPGDEQKQEAYMRECAALSWEAKLDLLQELRIQHSLREARTRKRKRGEQDGGDEASSSGGCKERKRGKFVKEGFAAEDGGVRILILATGSVATVKVPEIVVSLCKSQRLLELGGGVGATVKIVTSECGAKMLEKCELYDAKACKEFHELGVDVLQDVDEWEGYEDVRSDKVVHIELRRWADICLVAPCSANTLAKAACGQTDNLIMSVLRAWDPSKPLVVAPAMNTVMWEHPKTAEHLGVLQEWGYTVVPPAVKKLACNDTGRGALANVSEIVQAVCDLAFGRKMPRSEGSGIGEWAKLGFPEWQG